MTSILTWNIQCGLGCDGVHDLERIAEHIKNNGDPDIICLQEVIRFMPELDAGRGEDQVAVLSDLFPGFEVMYGAAIDQSEEGDDERRQFGNLILSRLPVLQVFYHSLPQPHHEGIKHMPRQVSEVVINAFSGPMRVLTTHLEYHSALQRMAQVKAIHELHQQVCDNIRRPGKNPQSGPYKLVARPETTVICGDFNFTPDNGEYTQLLSEFRHQTTSLIDAWRVCDGTRVHRPTCGIHDKRQWPEGPHARDFFFITEDLRTRIKDVVVDEKTDASDHQPVLLVLG